LKPRHLAIVSGAGSQATAHRIGPAELAEQLAEHCHRVTLICDRVLDGELNPRIERRPPRRLPWFVPGRRWIFTESVKRALRAADADAVIAYEPIVTCDLLVCLHGVDAKRGGVLRRGGVRDALAPTELIEQELHAATHSSTIAIHRIDLPLPTHAIDPATREADRRLLGRAFGIELTVPWLIAPPAAIQCRAGFEALLLGLRGYVKQGGNGVLLLAGRVRYNQLQRIAQLGLRDRVILAGPSDEPAQFYRLADLFVSPAARDPGGWAVRLALGAGLGERIITTTGCGVAQWVRDRGGAVLDLPVDADALAGVIREQAGAWSDGVVEPPDATTATPEPIQMLADAVEKRLFEPENADEGISPGR